MNSRVVERSTFWSYDFVLHWVFFEFFLWPNRRTRSWWCLTHTNIISVVSVFKNTVRNILFPRNFPFHCLVFSIFHSVGREKEEASRTQSEVRVEVSSCCCFFPVPSLFRREYHIMILMSFPSSFSLKMCDAIFWLREDRDGERKPCLLFIVSLFLRSATSHSGWKYQRRRGNEMRGTANRYTRLVKRKEKTFFSPSSSPSLYLRQHVNPFDPLKFVLFSFWKQGSKEERRLSLVLLLQTFFTSWRTTTSSIVSLSLSFERHTVCVPLFSVRLNLFLSSLSIPWKPFSLTTVSHPPHLVLSNRMNQ